MRHALVLLALSCLSLPSLCAESSTELAERFALADDREAVVAGLVPGTDEHFYYRALLWQHHGKLAEVDALMPRWKELHPGSSQRARIELRQAALWFDRDQAIGARRLAEAGGLEFTVADDAPVEAVARAPELPSVLPDNELAWESLVKRGDAGGTLDGWTEAGLARRSATLVDPVQRRAALKRLTWPTFPQVVELVLADLAAPGGDFGSLPLHARLSVAQLAACRAARPELVEDDDYVLTCIRAMRRGHDEARWSRDPASRLAWVQELSRFAADLPRTAQALKTHLALHLLDLELRGGQPTSATLIAVLSQPLPTGTLPQQTKGKPLQTEGSAAVIEATGLGTVPQIDRLIREALLVVFSAAPDTSAFAGLVDDEWLRRLFIEAKLLHGVGDAATWLTRAGDARLGLELKGRVELAFARSAVERFAGDDVVELPLVLKNVPALHVRIFALDAVNLYRTLGAEPTTAIDLSGVLPTVERTLAYDQPPIRRHHERLALPECAGPGMWLVELVGGGQVARALVRKGGLRFFSDDRPDGEHLHVIDEADRPVAGARVWEGDQQFTAGADGAVRLPYVVERRTRPLVLAGAGRAAVVSYQREQEDWSLIDGTLLDREQLIAGGRATVLLRPRLRLNGGDRPLSHARSVRAIVTTITHAGVRQVTTGEPPAGPGIGEWPMTVAVPDGLSSVEVVLRVTVRNQALGEDQDLATSATTLVNGNHLNDRIVELHLEQDQAGWSLVALGRAGETVAGEVLTLGFQHHLVQNRIHVHLQTGADGRVRLGHLPEVRAVTWDPSPARFRESNGAPQRRRWDLRPYQQSPGSLTIATDQALRLPITWRSTDAGPRDWWLLRGDERAVAEDFSDQVKIELAAGVPLLVAPRLPVGRYQLITPAGRTDVRVVAGTRRDALVLSPSAIDQLDTPTPLGVAVVAAPDAVRVQVAHATATTRVHVIGLRFHPPSARGFPTHVPGLIQWSQAEALSSYQDGAPLDAELRYILERARAAKLPGVMLERPGLVLNPWHDETFMAIGAGGGAPGMFGSRSGGAKRRALAKGGGARASEAFSEVWAQLDFLSGPGVIATNLKPDATGAVRLPAAQLGDARLLLAIACDGLQDVAAIAPLTVQPPLTLRERRLMAGLPATEHLVADRRGRALVAGAQAVLAQGGLDQSRTCGTVGELYRLFLALAPEVELTAFEPLTRWPQLTEAERRTWYGEHACHEVHLFLWHKDRRFFDAVVRPYLANKLQKTFIDHWLLDLDLTPWLAGDRHERLNLVERILLARRLAGEARTQELAHLGESFRDLPDATADLGARIATALSAQVGEVARAAGERRVEAPRPEPRPERREIGNELQEVVEINVATEADVNAPINQLDVPLAQSYRDLARPQGLIEQNWYRVPLAEQDRHLFAPSVFWQTFATSDPAVGFLTANCLLATASRNEVLLALALTDLPFTAAPPTVDAAADGARRLTATAPMLLFTQEVTPTALKPGEQLVHQRLYRLDQAPESSATAKPVEGPLMPGVAYLARSVVLNPTPQPVTVAALAQIPTGAVPLYASDTTIAEERTIAAYGSVTLDQAFYLPQAGTFTHFPTHVQSAAAVTAASAPTEVTVQAHAARAEHGRWSDDAAEIIARLEQAPLVELDLTGLYWRFNDAAFWRRVVAVLERRRWFDDTVWSFSVLHRDAARMAVWLRARGDLVEGLGRTLTSRWLTIDPLADGGVTHVDVAPLINARAHRHADGPAISDDLVATLWTALVTRLALEPALDDRARLELAYALTLQDRHGEASAHFARIDRARIAARLQYDYLGAYLALARGDLAAAARFAASGKDHPVARWRLRFAEVAAQLDELAGRAVVREPALGEQQRQAVQAVQAPGFQARLSDAGEVLLTTSNLASCTVRWHRLDLEQLFSRAPFATATATQVTQVRATSEQEVRPGADGGAIVPLPAALRHQPVAIEVLAAGQRQQFMRFADQLDVQVSPASGQLQVRLAGTGKPMPATYVKVYAEYADGRVVFHKDGYTDLRGRFDYASLGNGSVTGAKRLALFISHDQAGATVLEVLPP